MPLRDRSGQRWQPSGKPYVVAATKVCSRLIGVCWSLSPPPPPTLPFSFLAFWGFPEWNTQDFPFLSLVRPWTTVRSWEHLPFSFLSSPFLSLCLFPLFTFFLGCPWMLRHSWEPFLFGVSLDACAVAGNTFTSFSPSFFSPPPLPSPTSRVAYLQANQAFATGFSMRFGLSSVCPLSFGFPFIPPHRRFPFFLSCPSVFTSLHPHPFFLLRALSSRP